MPDAQYATADELKLNLEIKGVDSEDKLEELVADANSHVTRNLLAASDTAPVKKGDRYWGDARWCALTYARALWYEHKFLEDKSKYNMARFKERLDALIKALKATPTERQDGLITDRTDYESERPIPLMQLGYAGGTPRHLYDGFPRGG